MSGISLLSPGDPSGEMDAIWSDGSFLQAACAVELAWVEAAVEEGLAPAHIVPELNKRVNDVLADPSSVFTQSRIVGRPVAPLVDALAENAPLDLMRVLHLGLTTQDIIDTCLNLLKRRAVAQIDRQLDEVMHTLDALADAHRTTPMLVRTNGQIAAMTTFGLFLAESVAEFDRGRARLAEADQKNRRALLNGAVGLSSPFGEASDMVRHRTAKILDLTYDATYAAAPRDHVADLLFALCMIGKAAGRLARTIKDLQSEAIGELSEKGPGASSAMPHKQNPRLAERVIVLCDQLDAHVMTALQGTQTLHHRSGQSSLKEWSATQSLFLTLDAALDQCQQMMDRLIVADRAMREHIEQAGLRVISDRLFTALSRQLGRIAAKQMVADLLAEPADADDLLSQIKRHNPDVDLAAIQSAISLDSIIQATDAKQTEIEFRRTTRARLGGNER